MIRGGSDVGAATKTSQMVMSHARKLTDVNGSIWRRSTKTTARDGFLALYRLSPIRWDGVTRAKVGSCIRVHWSAIVTSAAAAVVHSEVTKVTQGADVLPSGASAVAVPWPVLAVLRCTDLVAPTRTQRWMTGPATHSILLI